jgi:hypothetical protein
MRIEALGKRHHYESWVAEFNEQEMPGDDLNELDAVTMEQYKQAFTQSSFQEELTGYFPLLHRIMSEANKIDLEDYVSEEDEEDEEVFDDVKESDFSKFTEWAEAVEQGKLTDDQIDDLKKALGELPQGAEGPELELGPNGQTAWQFFSQLGLDDSDLRDKLTASAEVSPDSDPFDAFKTWAQESYPELLVALGISGEEQPAEPPAPEAGATPPAAAPVDPAAAPAPEQPVAEGKGNKMVQEVAKIVKSFYNRDNPNVGPFRGEEGIALDIKKQIAEKFGDDAGEQAQQMAEQFMTKLTQEWHQRHGKVSNGDGGDGLARLKELVGNIKGRVEEMGGDTGVPPGNIMPSTEMESILRLINYKK